MPSVSTPAADAVLLSLGSVNADFQMRVARWPEVSETLMASDFVRLSGGKAANRAFLAAKFGLPTRLIGMTGDDDLREQALGALRDAGVDLDCVYATGEQPTAVSMITVPPDGKKGIVLAANANRCWSEDSVGEALQAIRGAPDGSVLSLDVEVPPDVARRAIEAAQECGIPVILDPSPAEDAGDLAGKVGYLAPNAGEAKALADIDTEAVEGARRAALALRERGAGTVFVKLGDGGCVLAGDEGVVHVPAEPVDVVDTTGAGDAFSGALAVAILLGKPVREAACFAVATASLAVTGYGSQPAYPERADVEALAGKLLGRLRELRG
ncbi:ribokinase [Faunimonas pinastri]|uniref:Ribokinase n=1 Tax=Faunimonas pinastri TaxID=1855383 RepID=A0A1H9FXN6_9HYPH|nr:ribokinase [Faunimonas pinastri]SEQ42617.1 ribokinase [Faunimonas pinastri]